MFRCRWRLVPFHLLAVAGLLLVSGCELDPCLADEGGCTGKKTISLSGCPTAVAPVALSQFVVGLKPPAGTVLTVQGPLRQETSMCTQLGCGAGGCCNSCTAWLLLSENPQPGVASVADLRLHGQLDGIQLGCEGDESLVCCPLPTDGTPAVVTGRLVESGLTLEGIVLGLDVMQICLPD